MSKDHPISIRAGQGLVWLIVIGMFVQLCVIVYVGVNADDNQDELAKAERRARQELRVAEKKARVRLVKAQKKSRRNLVRSQRAGCRRSKLDRRDNADFQRAHSLYIFKVTGAASVKEDVKQAAREARKTFTRTSAGLEERSKINCKKAFP